MPPNTVYVGRPSRWGNEFTVGAGVTPQIAVARYALHLRDYFSFVDGELRRAFHPWPVKSTAFTDWLEPLRGKNLAYWCPLVDESGNKVPCHADVLLEIANA